MDSHQRLDHSSPQNMWNHDNLHPEDGPSLVPPSPELRLKIKEEMALLLGSSSDLMGTMLRVMPRSPIGMNDGLIRPGSDFPIDTAPALIRSAAADRAPMRGKTRVIIVLVEFNDNKLEKSKQHYEDLFFSSRVLQNGSVKEYYTEVSNGLVEISGEVVGPYTLPMTLLEYAHSASGTGVLEPNARTMARAAAEAANPDVDFSPYDNDNDDYVDAFIVLHAGPGAESTGSVNDIWSHKWVFAGGDYDADGTKLYAYLTVPEDAKIGVCCHELGHLLFGFPDLYDTDYSSEGVGYWCLMGTGSWLGGGDIPAHLSAWCKLKQGWVTKKSPVGSSQLQIEDVKSSHTVYRLWKNAAGGNEYYLVENRQKTKFDRDLPGEGLLIWHVDETIPTNSDEIHPKVALVQSDGKKDLENGSNRGDQGDPFPGITDNKTFDAASTPNSNSYSSLDTCVKVQNISASGPIMTATVVTSCEVDNRSWRFRLRDWFSRFRY